MLRAHNLLEVVLLRVLEIESVVLLAWSRAPSLGLGTCRSAIEWENWSVPSSDSS